MRLNKLLAERLGISRREADNLIENKRVQVDGRSAEVGMQVAENQDVIVDGRKIDYTHNYTYLMLNKPR